MRLSNAAILKTTELCGTARWGVPCLSGFTVVTVKNPIVTRKCHTIFHGKLPIGASKTDREKLEFSSKLFIFRAFEGPDLATNALNKRQPV